MLSASWGRLRATPQARLSSLRRRGAKALSPASMMRPDGLSGTAVLITPDAIVGKSPNDLLKDFLSEAGLDGYRAFAAVEIDAAPTSQSSE